MKRNRKVNFAILIISLIFVFWSAFFIYQISFVAIDGKRYVNLFDDAMISMRYAWNFSHGLGLVWNPGEYVEGYTNLLMTLYMSFVTLIVDDKRLAVLFINISGIFMMLGIAYATLLIADRISLNESQRHRTWLKHLSFATVLFYYPLAYWTLMGMETGLVTLLILLGIVSALRYVSQPTTQRLFLISIYLGLAYLTRPDAFVAAFLSFTYIFFETQVPFQKLGAILPAPWRFKNPKGLLPKTIEKIQTYQPKPSRPHLISLLAAVSLYALFIAGQQLFRWNYYGEWVPNTYTLKATGMPLAFRIRDGISYLVPFAETTLIAVVLMGVGLLFNRQRQKLLLVMITLAYFAYQIWVGGDAFPPYWRLITPVMPLILVMSIQGIIGLTEVLFGTTAFRRYSSLGSAPATSHLLGLVVTLVTITVFISVNAFFIRQILFLSKPYEAEKNEYHVNTAIALNELTTKDATIGVSSAGIVPYYTDERIAIDFLGKSDKYIANLPPDLSGGARYGSIFSLPGHNKYDLNYSIKVLQPTYVQIAGWGGQDLTEWVAQRYADIKYKGVQLYLRKDSKAVLWYKIDQIVGRRQVE